MIPRECDNPKCVNNPNNLYTSEMTHICEECFKYYVEEMNVDDFMEMHHVTMELLTHIQTYDELLSFPLPFTDDDLIDLLTTKDMTLDKAKEAIIDNWKEKINVLLMYKMEKSGE